jgi:Domain of unknown function (DUF5103)
MRISVISFSVLFLLLIACASSNRKVVNKITEDSLVSEKPVVANIPFYIDKKLRTDNWNYESSIKTVLLYPQLNDDPDRAVQLPPPVISLEQSVPLVLEFDELTDQTHAPFHAKILHCNADWTLSPLNDIEFLTGYNDLLINEFEYSSGTKVAYLHYKYNLPKVKISGNYLIMVYRESNIKDLILTRRFVVFENLVEIPAKIGTSAGISERQTDQQVDLGVSFSGYNLINPLQSVKVVILQNQNWLGAVRLSPFNVEETRLNYTFFNLENSIPGGNEFRFFDIRSLRSSGMNVARLTVRPDTNRVQLATDLPRATQSYARLQDMNGDFVIDHYELSRGATNSDYTPVTFYLKTEEQPGRNLYIFGALTNRQLLPEARLQYDNVNQVYTTKLLLKQGFYNFEYVTEKNGRPETVLIEGNHFETENQYEILVYYRPPAARNDLIIGYKTIQANGK